MLEQRARPRGALKRFNRLTGLLGDLSIYPPPFAAQVPFAFSPAFRAVPEIMELLRRQMQWMALLMALPATLAYTLAYTSRSATSHCFFPVSKAQCRAFRTQSPYYDDSRGFSTSNAFEEATLYIGGIGNFEVSDRYLTHGCQWYVDPTHPENNRFLYNDENADAPKFANEQDTVNAECSSPELWCYPTYSHRVCGGNGLPLPSFPLWPPLPAPTWPSKHPAHAATATALPGIAPSLPTAAVLFLPILILVAALVLWKKFSVGADGEVCARIETISPCPSVLHLRQRQCTAQFSIAAGARHRRGEGATVTVVSVTEDYGRRQVSERQVSEGPTRGNGLTPQRQRGRTRVISMR